MKLKQSIRYQLADFIGPVIVYYGIVAAAHVVLFWRGFSPPPPST